jgi:O-antigen/teichoic acid export membrane protein
LGVLPIIIGLGIPLAVRQFAAQGRSADSAVRSARIYALATLPVCIGAGLILRHSLLRSLDGRSGLAFVAGCALIPVAVAWICDVNVLYAQARYFATAVVNLTQGAVYVTSVAVASLVTTLNVPLVILAYSFGTVVTAALSSLLCRVSLRGEYASPRELLRQGLRFAAGQLGEMASYRLDSLIVLPLLGAEQAGYYAVATTIGQLPLGVGQGIGSAFFGEVAMVRGDRGAASRVSAHALRLASATGLVSAFVLVVASPVAIPLIFGDSFRPAVIPAMIASGAGTFLVAAYVGTQLLVGMDMGRELAFCQISGLVVGIGLLLAAGPHLGAVGASVASGAGYMVTAAAASRSASGRLSSILPRGRDFGGIATFFLRGAGRPGAGPDSGKELREEERS